MCVLSCIVYVKLNNNFFIPYLPLYAIIKHMGMFKKLIGLILLVVIFFFLINSKGMLSFLNTIALGPTKTPIQVGSLYSARGESVVGTFKIQNPQGVNKVFGAATVSKVDNQLVLIAEHIALPIERPWSFWLSNTPTISNATNYVDFGKVTPPYSYKEYLVGVETGLNLSVYKYLMILDPISFEVYAVATLIK